MVNVAMFLLLLIIGLGIGAWVTEAIRWRITPEHLPPAGQDVLDDDDPVAVYEQAAPIEPFPTDGVCYADGYDAPHHTSLCDESCAAVGPNVGGVSLYEVKRNLRAIRAASQLGAKLATDPHFTNVSMLVPNDGPAELSFTLVGHPADDARTTIEFR